MDNFSISSNLKLFHVCGLMNKAQIKRTIVYGTARTGDYFIVEMQTSQSVLFHFKGKRLSLGDCL